MKDKEIRPQFFFKVLSRGLSRVVKGLSYFLASILGVVVGVVRQSVVVKKITQKEYSLKFWFPHPRFPCLLHL